MSDQPGHMGHHNTTFSDADIAEIGEEDLRVRLQALDDAQSTWEELAYLANPKMPCPECSGGGYVASGSLGDVCVRCGGDRVIDQPGGAKVDLEQFKPMRVALAAYGEALDDRLFPDDPDGARAKSGLRSRRNLALPAPATVPTLEAIQKLQADGEARVQQAHLAGAPGIVDPKRLKASKRAKGLAGDGDLGEYEDAEIAAMEDDI